MAEPSREGRKSSFEWLRYFREIARQTRPIFNPLAILDPSQVVDNRGLDPFRDLIAHYPYEPYEPPPPYDEGPSAPWTPVPADWPISPERGGIPYEDELPPPQFYDLGPISPERGGIPLEDELPPQAPVPETQELLDVILPMIQQVLMTQEDPNKNAPPSATNAAQMLGGY